MKLYRCVATHSINQYFGRDKTDPELLPSYEAMGLRGHNGVDFGCYRGEKIYWDASCKGTVIESTIDSKSGFGITIVTEDESGRFKHIFWHNMCNAVRVGQVLETGHLIALGDSTGFSTGNHVHRGLKRCDSNNYTLDHDNGYLGAIDPMPFYNDIFVVDKMRELLGIIARIKFEIQKIKEQIYALQKDTPQS